jgi:hypothetical protein
MNEHKNRINMARIRYPLKNTVLINPEIGMLVNEFGVEMPNSNIRNTIEVEKFIINLEMKYNQESN